MVKEHPDWYTDLYLPDGSLNTERWDDHRLTTWFDVFLPTLDVAKPEVCEAMTDSALWWVLNSDIDGFRHDATKHIPEGFWRMLTRKIRTQAPGRPMFQIGETYGSTALIRSYVHSGMLDAQFDFNHYDAAIAAIGLPGGRMEDLVRTARESLRAYGADHAMGNISGNQDRPRFASLADGSVRPDEDTKYAGWTRSIQHANARGFERTRLLMAYLMASPGIPCIYYGDEIADVGGNDPDNRRPFRSTDLFDEELQTRSWTAGWVKLRRSRMSMMYGATGYAVLSPGLLRIDRTYLGERTVILINASEGPVRVTWPEGTPKVLAGNGTAIDGAVDLPAGGAVAIEG
jgi:glycosidase